VGGGGLDMVVVDVGVVWRNMKIRRFEW